MERANLPLLIIVLGLAAIYFLWLWNKIGSKSMPYKSTDKQLQIKAVDAPDEQIRFLVYKFNYETDSAKEVWRSIRDSNGFEDFYATRIFAHKLYIEWYMRLSDAEKRKYEWDMRDKNLTVEIQKRADYQAYRSELINYIFSIRSYSAG